MKELIKPQDNEMNPLSKLFPFLGRGTVQEVYDLDVYVMKVIYRDSRHGYQDQEQSSKMSDKQPYYARSCRPFLYRVNQTLGYLDGHYGQVVFQEKLTPINMSDKKTARKIEAMLDAYATHDPTVHEYSTRKEWKEQLLAYQWGTTRNGQFKIYDFL
jgi:hypothetical protein